MVVLGMNAALCEGGTSSLPGEEGKGGEGRGRGGCTQKTWSDHRRRSYLKCGEPSVLISMKQCVDEEPSLF